MRLLPNVRLLELASQLLPERIDSLDVCSILVGRDELGATIKFQVTAHDDQVLLVARWAVAQRARVVIVHNAHHDYTRISAAWRESVPGVDPIHVTVWGRLTPKNLRVLADEAGVVVDDYGPVTINAWQLLAAVDGDPVAGRVS
ncbi:MAG: hypothetical protein ABIQ18_37745 [Umezawaea sp.]